MNKPQYTSRSWLSGDRTDPSHCVAVDGWTSWDDTLEHIYFDVATSTESTIRIQQHSGEPMQNIIDKLQVLRDELDAFIKHLHSKD